MSLLAKAVLAFSHRPAERITRHDELVLCVPWSTWEKWLDFARREERLTDRRAHELLEAMGPSALLCCKCHECLGRRQAPLPLEPSQRSPSPQREPEGPAEGGGAAGARSGGDELHRVPGETDELCTRCGEPLAQTRYRLAGAQFCRSDGTGGYVHEPRCQTEGGSR